MLRERVSARTLGQECPSKAACDRQCVAADAASEAPEFGTRCAVSRLRASSAISRYLRLGSWVHRPSLRGRSPSALFVTCRLWDGPCDEVELTVKKLREAVYFYEFLRWSTSHDRRRSRCIALRARHAIRSDSCQNSSLTRGGASTAMSEPRRPRLSSPVPDLMVDSIRWTTSGETIGGCAVCLLRRRRGSSMRHRFY